MTCQGQWAQAWEYAGFWCNAPLVGYHDGGMAASDLSDAARPVGFVEAGIKPDVGMVLYNLTKGTSGLVTDATETTLEATGVAWDTGDQYRISVLDATEIYALDARLKIMSGNVNAALSASGQCDCSLAAWAADYLKKLVIVEAAAFYGCPCSTPGISEETRRDHFRWAADQLRLLRIGEIDVCGGTGSAVPAFAWAEHAFNEMAAERIVLNEWVRESDV